MSSPSESLSVQEVAYEVLPYFIFFQTLYWVCWVLSPSWFATVPKLDHDQRAYWACSMVSTIHAVLISAFTIETWRRTPDLLFSKNPDDLHMTTTESYLCFRFFLGYLASDLLVVAYYNKRWAGFTATTIHHTAGLCVWGSLCQHGLVHCLGLLGIIAELTTAFINLRWFLDVSGMKDTKLYLLNGLTITVLWFWVRIVAFGMIGWHLYEARSALAIMPVKQAVIIVGGWATGYALQLFWGYKIFRGAYRILTGQTKNKGDKAKKTK